MDSVDEKAPETVKSSGWRRLCQRLYGCWRVLPCFGLSLLWHGALVLFLSALTLSLCLKDNRQEMVILCSELMPEPEVAPEAKPTAIHVLQSSQDTPPIDPTSPEASDIVVPPDILAKAELGDHFETINPDRPDTSSAFGNPEMDVLWEGNSNNLGGGGPHGRGLEDMLGVGSRLGTGAGGGWGGGQGTGIGIGSASGRGSFGYRNGGGRALTVKRHGGGMRTDAGRMRYTAPRGLDAALSWLARNQAESGQWDCSQHKGRDHDIAVTGLALLAFLRAGQSEDSGRYQEQVARAIAYLRSQQQASGMIAPKIDRAGYTHAIAALSLTEAARVSHNPQTIKAAEQALQWSCSGQNASNLSLGWRYSGPSADADLSVTGWYLLQLSAAREAGLHVSETYFKNAGLFLSTVAVRGENGGTVFQYRPGSHSNPRLNAIGHLCRELVGLQTQEKHTRAENLLLPDPAQPDLYLWYYGSLYYARQDDAAALRWNADLRQSLVAAQNKGGALKGSWEPAGPYSEHWGRVGQTALAALCLEAGSRGKPVPPVNARAKDAGKKPVAGLAKLDAAAVAPTEVASGESYAELLEQGYKFVTGDLALSTFAIDVDTASYSNIRRMLNSNQRPPRNAIRVEEMVNYFKYNYATPKKADAFSLQAEVAQCPWNEKNRLALIALKGREIEWEKRNPTNLVFLIDVSGSMDAPNKLPLIKNILTLLIERLDARDHVSIVTYAGDTRVALEQTAGDRRSEIKAVIDGLSAGGSTNGAGGIEAAYRLAVQGYIQGGINRVMLCTDGDFNVGISDENELMKLIQEKAKSGVFLSVMGFGMGNYKDSKLETLADKGNGNYGYIDNEKEGRKLLADALAGTVITIAKDVKVQVEFNPQLALAYRLVGYENRLMAAGDFRNDVKDAGELGAGHTVTALFEIVPCSSEASIEAGTQPLKYQMNGGLSEAAGSGELFTLYVRHKLPAEDKASEMNLPVSDCGGSWKQASENLRWASAVSMFAMQLRGSKHKGACDWPLIEQMAQQARGTDAGAERAEFLELIQKAKQLAPLTPAQGAEQDF